MCVDVGGLDVYCGEGEEKGRENSELVKVGSRINLYKGKKVSPGRVCVFCLLVDHIPGWQCSCICLHGQLNS